MRKSLFIAFVAGAVVGSVTTWGCIKNKYEKLAQEEIDSVKAVFAQKEARPEAKVVSDEMREAAERAKNKPDVREYATIIQNNMYISDAVQNESEEKMKGAVPYVISPEEFAGEFDDYEKISLTYYADKVLADENDEIVDNVEDIVGDALDHFGEYEDDAVFVRCDERMCDYEILLDHRTYEEVVAGKPNRVEV